MQLFERTLDSLLYNLNVVLELLTFCLPLQTSAAATSLAHIPFSLLQ